MMWLEQSLQDIRYSLRVLGRSPRFTAAVVLTLSLGIGVNTAAFSVVNAVLLRPLAYPGADRLIWLADFDAWSRQDTMGSRADFEVWRAEANSFEQMTAYGSQDFAVFANGVATQERITSVTGDFWAITGARPELGRLFEESEADQIVLSHRFAEHRFPGETQLIGKALLVNGHSFTVSGVLSEEFRFDFPQLMNTAAEKRQTDAYIPIAEGSEQPGEPIPQERGPAPSWASVVGKLQPGVAIEQARAEMTLIHDRLSQQFPSPTRGRRLTVAPLAEKIVGEARRALLILLAAAGFVLLIAAANVGNLLLARNSKRQQEVAVRSAMGASQARVARQIVTECLVLAALGGAAGLALAHWTVGLVLRLGAGAVPRLAEAQIDVRVIAFASGASLLAALLFSLAAVLSCNGPLLEGLKGDSRASSDGVGTQRFRNVLVVSELALALMLLSGAGLMLKSFWRMNERPAGFTPQNILSMHIPLSGPAYESWLSKESYIRQLLDGLEAIPGVESAGIDAGTLNTTAQVEGGPSESRPEPSSAAIRMVSPGYLRAMGSPLARGRWPAAGEELDVVLVNETFARGLGGGGDIVGKQLGGSFLSGTIIGVVADFKHTQLDAAPRPEVYHPYQRSPRVGSIRVVARVTEPSTAAPLILELASEVDRTQPIYRFGTLEALLADSIAPRLFNLALLGTFSVTAVLLALVGVYGVVAYSVEQRTREVGIRMALGARREEVVRMIVRQGAGLGVTGIVMGLAGAVALSHWLDSLLYAVEANDPVTLAVVAIGLFVMALLACCGPALRAARVNPVSALRHS
jgi:putative ABC transport system permease protein